MKASLSILPSPVAGKYDMTYLVRTGVPHLRRTGADAAPRRGSSRSGNGVLYAAGRRGCVGAQALLDLGGERHDVVVQPGQELGETGRVRGGLAALACQQVRPA